MTTRKTDTWMPLVIGDYLKDTGRLTTEQHGAYLLLIMDYWVNGPPADDDEELASITKLDPRSWKKQRPKIERLFRVEGGVWRHKRIDQELVDAASNSAKRSGKASAAASARWERERTSKHPDDGAPGNAPSTAPSNAPDMLEQCPSPSPTPTGVISDANASSAAQSATGPWSKDADFSKAWDAATPQMRKRSSKAKSWPEWRKARKTAPAAKIAEAMPRYVAADPDVERTGGPGFHIWLRDRKFEHWLDEVDASTALVAWTGPADIRQAIVKAKGQAWAVSYLDRCRWRDLPDKAVLSENSFVVDTLRRDPDAAAIFSAHGVRVLLEQAA